MDERAPMDGAVDDDRSSGSGAGRLLAFVVIACLIAGTGWWVVDRSGWIAMGAVPTITGVASDPASSQSASPSREAGLAALLDARAAALVNRDRPGWAATVDPDLPQFQSEQLQVFDNLSTVPLSVVRFQYAGDGPPLSEAQQTTLGPTAWVAKVLFSYRIEGVDTADVRHEQFLTVAQRSGDWFVAGTGDGPAQPRELWELGPVYTLRGNRSMVIGTTQEGLGDLATAVDKAAEQVDAVWGQRWPRTVVVLVPSSQTEMAQLLGRTDEVGLDQIAAVTTGEVGLPIGEGADRVIVNPAGFGQLDALGADVVLTHEVTHVATRAAGPGYVPIWFSEGFSDYVAYTGRDLSAYQIAGDVLDQVAEGKGPTALPTDADFDATHSAVAPAYSSSYLAIDYLAEKYGEDKVIQLYRLQAGGAGPEGTASTPVPLAVAMPQVVDVDVTAFQQAWLDHLKKVA